MDAVIGFFTLSGGEIILLLVVVLLFFGGRKLPQLAKGLGQSIKEFKNASREEEDSVANSKSKPALPTTVSNKTGDDSKT